MNKKTLLILIILMFLLVIPLIKGAIQIEYSVDNASWESIIKLNKTAGTGYQYNLKAETLYYFRAKNSTADWKYFTQQTQGYIPEVVAIILSVITIIFLVLFIKETKETKNKTEENNFLIYIYLFAILFIAILSTYIINNINLDSNLTPIFFILIILTTITFLYFLIIFIKNMLSNINQEI